MEIKTKEITNQNYLILKENESITILVEKDIKSSIHIVCKNKKLFIKMEEGIKKNKKEFNH